MALNRGQRFGSRVAGPEPIAVNCTLVTAGRLLKVAQRSCPDVVPEIRAAMEEARQEQTIGATSEQPPADLNATALRLSTERLQRAVQLFADYHLEATHSQLWQALKRNSAGEQSGPRGEPLLLTAAMSRACRSP